MAFADPQSITIDTVPVALPRTAFGTNQGDFTSPDGKVKLRISHANGRNGSTRRLLRLEEKMVAADPLTAVNQEMTGSVHIVVDMPRHGFSIDRQTELVKALAAYLTATSSARTIQLLGGES